MPVNLDKFQTNLDYRFSDLNLARQALTHRSANKIHNERLEYLGDSLLGFIVAEALFDLYPQAAEGELSRMRASLVNKDSLAEIAREIELGDFMLLGTGELKSGGKQRDSILADALEAVIAAIYLDGGLAVCREVVKRWSTVKIAAKNFSQNQKDCKTQLQEIMQSRGRPLPSYTVKEITGKAHQQKFLVECSIEDMNESQTGSGSSKRVAEQQAAEKMLELLAAVEQTT
jgi:ribonuclease-3